MLGADDDRPPADRLPDRAELLQRTGGEHASGPVAGHEPGRARSLAHAGREHDRPRIDRDLAERCGQLGAAAVEGDHRGVGADLGTGAPGAVDELGGVARAGREPVQVADAVSEVLGVARDAARLGSRSTTVTVAPASPARWRR